MEPAEDGQLKTPGLRSAQAGEAEPEKQKAGERRPAGGHERRFFRLVTCSPLLPAALFCLAGQTGFGLQTSSSNGATDVFSMAAVGLSAAVVGT